MKTSNKAAMAALAMCALLLAASQGLSQSRASETLVKHKDYFYAEIAKAPEKARQRLNPLETDHDAVTAGGNLFLQHCAECHGDSADGGRKGPSLRVQEIQGATPGALFWLLTNGVVRRGMPVWSKLPEPQRWQLVTYIKSLGVKSADAAAQSQQSNQ